MGIPLKVYEVVENPAGTFTTSDTGVTEDYTGGSKIDPSAAASQNLKPTAGHKAWIALPTNVTVGDSPLRGIADEGDVGGGILVPVRYHINGSAEVIVNVGEDSETNAIGKNVVIRKLPIEEARKRMMEAKGGGGPIKK